MDHSDHSDHGDMSSMSDDMMGSMANSTETTTTADMSEPFCEGDGRVMLSGLQSSINRDCILFLFENASVDTATKYAFAVIGVFLMGFANEMIRYQRDLIAKGDYPALNNDLVKTFAFAVQMLIAYFLMLLVMLYEYVFLIFIILGLSVGHFLTLRWSASRKERMRAKGEKTPPEAVGSSGTPCCNNDTAA